MGLDELFFRHHQIALMRAAGSRGRGERDRQSAAAADAITPAAGQ